MQFLLSNHSPNLPSDLTPPELMRKNKTAQPFPTSFSEIKQIYAGRDHRDLAKGSSMLQWLLLLQPWETSFPVEAEDPFKDQRWQSPPPHPTPRLTVDVSHWRSCSSTQTPNWHKMLQLLLIVSMENFMATCFNVGLSNTRKGMICISNTGGRVEIRDCSPQAVYYSLAF